MEAERPGKGLPLHPAQPRLQVSRGTTAKWRNVSDVCGDLAKD